MFIHCIFKGVNYIDSNTISINTFINMIKALNAYDSIKIKKYENSIE